MSEPVYIRAIDDVLPPRYGLLYGLQWVIIMFPGLIIVARLSGVALHLDADDQVRFFQLTLLTSGVFTALQNLSGHRYPLLEGPSTALMLTLITLSPYGVDTIRGGMAVGGILLVALVSIGKLDRLIACATPNVVGVILMLIALTLLPHLMRIMAGMSDESPGGDGGVFFTSMMLVLGMAGISYWSKGFIKTVSLLIGIIIGSVVFFLIAPPAWSTLDKAGWFSLPLPYTPLLPRFQWPAVASFAFSYLAVLVNSLGSIHGVAEITDRKRLPRAISRGVFFNGLAGLLCGLVGVVGTVSYSLSPGVILANRVASRFALAYGGGILIAAAFIPKLPAAFALIPPQVVGAALFVGMGAQLGAGLSVVSSDGIEARDYFVVGLPLLFGTGVAFLPAAMVEALPTGLQLVLGNGLVAGIILVLLLEHVIIRRPSRKKTNGM